MQIWLLLHRRDCSIVTIPIDRFAHCIAETSRSPIHRAGSDAAMGRDAVQPREHAARSEYSEQEQSLIGSLRAECVDSALDSLNNCFMGYQPGQ